MMNIPSRLLALVALILSLTHCADSDTNLSLVGLWERTTVDAIGRSHRHVFEFRDDGTYTYHDNVFGHAGTYSASDGSWSSVANQGRLMNDQGSYSFDNPDTLVLDGVFDRTVWKRVRDQVYLVTYNVGGQPVPRGMPLVVARVLADIARPWRTDAIPVVLEFERLPYGPLAASIDFYSPSTGGGLSVRIRPFEMSTSTFDSVRWTTQPIPANFIDLPDVVRIAREQGINQPLEDSRLQFWERGYRAWALNFSGQELILDALTGAPITDELTDYAEDYNRGWQQAVEQLRRAFPDRSSDGWDWGSPDESDSLPSWCRDERYDAWRNSNFTGHC